MPLTDDQRIDAVERALDHHDRCQVCHGEKGCIPGEERVLSDGRIVCVYCHIDSCCDGRCTRVDGSR
jgi:hypothetical protein